MHFLCYDSFNEGIKLEMMETNKNVMQMMFINKLQQFTKARLL